MKRATILILTLALALGASTALAHGHGHGHGHHKGCRNTKAMGPRTAMDGPGGPIMRMLARLDLSDAQRDRIRTIMEQARPRFQEQREALMNVRQQLRDLNPASFDEAAVRRIAAGLATPMQEIAVLRQQVRSQVWAVLTPEQRGQAETLCETMQQRRDSMRGCMNGQGRQNGPATP